MPLVIGRDVSKIWFEYEEGERYLIRYVSPAKREEFDREFEVPLEGLRKELQKLLNAEKQNTKAVERIRQKINKIEDAYDRAIADWVIADWQGINQDVDGEEKPLECTSANKCLLLQEFPDRKNAILLKAQLPQAFGYPSMEKVLGESLRPRNGSSTGRNTTVPVA